MAAGSRNERVGRTARFEPRGEPESEARRIHELSPAEALEALHASEAGLSPREAAERLARFGPNELAPVGKSRHLGRRFLGEFTHFFALVLWIAAGLALLLEWSQPGQGMGTLAGAIVVVVLVNGVFSFAQEYRAEQALAALRSLLPRRARVWRGGALLEESASRLVPGDVILLQEGDAVPADSRVLSAEGLRVSNATLTGESAARTLGSKGDAAPDPLQSGNLAWAGTTVISGDGRALVFATGMRTEFGRIALLAQAGREEDSPLRREIARLSRIISVLALGLGLLFLVLGLAVGVPLGVMSLAAIGIIVANVPEGLLPTLTLSLAIAAQRMAARQALVRHLPKIEALGATTVICTDKTGTLTRNVMQVTEAWLADGAVARDSLEPGHPAARALIEGAWLCHNLLRVGTGGREHLSGDPMEVALHELASRFSEVTSRAPDEARRIGQIPFDTERKRMSAAYAGPRGVILYTKGAPETVLPLCKSVLRRAGLSPLDEGTLLGFQEAQARMAEGGLRVIAFAHRPPGALSVPGIPPERDLVLDALVGIEDPPREEVHEAIARCRDAGIRVIMVTGDHPGTAEALGRKIGLFPGARPRILLGARIRRMPEAQLELELGSAQVLAARAGPEDKMRIVLALKRMGEIVAVTGDGVNDAPALRKAHVGIAMGLSGTDVAREAADIVLLDDCFATIVSAIEEGRAVFDNIRKFLTYILTSNVPELVPYLGFVLLRLPLALTVIQILAVDLGTDMVPALALGAERPGPETMRRPPRRKDEPLVTPGLLARAYLFLGAIESAIAMASFFVIQRGGGGYREATTACLVGIVASQVVNLLVCRDPRESVFSPRAAAANRLLWGGLLAESALTLWIVFSRAGNAIFGTAPLDARVLAVIVPGAAAMLLLEELRKALVRRRARVLNRMGE